MSIDIDNFIAKLHGSPDAATYHAHHQACLARLDELQTPFALTSEAEYRNADAVRRMLSSLSCYTTNCQHQLNDQVWALERVWGTALVAYNRRLLLKDPSARLIARYMLWSFMFADVDRRAAFVLGRRHGVLRKVMPPASCVPRLCVIGLDRAVGDNVFSVDRRGREHRRYGRTIGRQAFPVQRAMPWTGSDVQAFLDTIPGLDATYHVTEIGDHKYGSRGSAFRREARRRLHELLVGEEAGDLSPTDPTMPVEELASPLHLPTELLAVA